MAKTPGFTDFELAKISGDFQYSSLFIVAVTIPPWCKGRRRAGGDRFMLSPWESATPFRAGRFDQARFRGLFDEVTRPSAFGQT
jgi:hypothetical protein